MLPGVPQRSGFAAATGSPSSAITGRGTVGVDVLEIQAIRKTPVGRLPYGLQKRVELGRALAMEPDLLLLDEPMAGMNAEETKIWGRPKSRGP